MESSSKEFGQINPPPCLPSGEATSKELFGDHEPVPVPGVIDGGGARHNQNKSRLDLICPYFLEDLGEVLRYGAEKYDERNWERGNNWGVPTGSLMRHLTAFMRGEDIDPESGLPHTAMMAFNVMQLHRNWLTYPEGDGRSEVCKEQTRRI